jgi:hypothetical protein
MVSVVIICQILSVGSGIESYNTLLKHTEIFLEDFQYVPHLINHRHLKWYKIQLLIIFFNFYALLLVDCGIFKSVKIKGDTISNWI